jgi:catechol 2,3-dioxygenase-like lactoylglutathione lyase family enzyme
VVREGEALFGGRVVDEGGVDAVGASRREHAGEQDRNKWETSRGHGYLVRPRAQGILPRPLRHSGIKTAVSGASLVAFRDPDNIRLEFVAPQQ